jgi:predicted RNase H-like nuclease
MEVRVIAGIDGTSRGWVAVICNDNLANPVAQFLPRLADLPRGLSVVAIDIPIGLPELGDRAADRQVRSILGEPRRRSVFPCLIRPALAAQTREEACWITECIDGRRVSKQTFALKGKIYEADQLLQEEKWACQVFREAHPELSFCRWHLSPMRNSKKSTRGHAERRQLIDAKFGEEAFGALQASLRGYRVTSDDLADAIACAWTAARIREETAECHPQQAPEDTLGIPMRIWA